MNVCRRFPVDHTFLDCSNLSNCAFSGLNVTHIISIIEVFLRFFLDGFVDFASVS